MAIIDGVLLCTASALIHHGERTEVAVNNVELRLTTSPNTTTYLVHALPVSRMNSTITCYAIHAIIATTSSHSEGPFPIIVDREQTNNYIIRGISEKKLGESEPSMLSLMKVCAAATVVTMHKVQRSSWPTSALRQVQAN